jgi:antirestriction protein ArdC
VPDRDSCAGFRRGLGLGYAVRKGERGIRIWAPCPPSAKKIRAWKEARADPASRPRTYFRLAVVFDRSQVEPLPEFPGGPVDLEPPIEPVQGDGLAHLFEPLAAFGASLGYSVKVEAIGGASRGLCDRKARRISVDQIGEAFSANAQVAVEVHELAHALVGCERREEDPTISNDEEEIVVECVAFSVCATLGLDTSGSFGPLHDELEQGR